MKKTVAFILLTVFVCMTGIVVSAAPYADYKWISEDYEQSDVSNAIVSTASITRVEEGAGGSNGAALITITANYGAVKYNVNMVSGGKYKISAWIKMKNAVPLNDEMHFILFFPEKTSDGSAGGVLYTDVPIKPAGLSTTEWKYYESTYTHDGKGTKVGAGRLEVLENGTAEVRIGNGLLSTMNGSPIDFYLDDFAIQPVIESTTNLVKSGDFESGIDTTNWTISSAMVTEGTGGANGTNKYAKIEVTGNYGTLKQRVPILFNKSYKISFYYKAGAPEVVGKTFQMIFDRSDRKDDKYTASKYEYISCSPLGEDWIKKEFIYRTSYVTFETQYPTLYFRSGDGVSKDKYCIDEFTVEEVGGSVYNGDFEAAIGSEWTKSGVTAVNSTDVPYAESQKSAYITETANYGSIKQGVYMIPGKTYTLSFWAKAESWTGDTSESSISITPVLDRYVATPSANDTYMGPTYEYLPDNTNSTRLTKSWQKYEFTYSPAVVTTTYRLPILYFRIGDNGGKSAKYYMDDISIKEQGNLGFNVPLAENLRITGNPVEMQNLEFSYDYNCKLNQRGSVIRILRAADDTAAYWVTVKTEATDFNSIGYEISEKDIGKKLKIEVLPMNENGEAGKVKSITTDIVKSAFSVIPSFTAAWDTAQTEIGAKVSLDNNSDSKDVIVMLSLFDENNLMCAQTEQYKNIAQGETADVILSVPVSAEAVTARLFVWEGTTSVNTSMASFVDFIQLQKN